MAWEIMGTGHLTGGAWGPGCTGICPYGAYPHRLREARGSGSPLGDPGLVNMDYQVGFGGAEHHDVLLSHSTARSECLMRSSRTSSAVRWEA